ncbi:MAG TPA: hypothetical protein VLT61_09005, partial [Anaeromyxobacteraceae bacterium]|nr:hypothetical protein [Anaeromyxobacteraceae bacterium]
PLTLPAPLVGFVEVDVDVAGVELPPHAKERREVVASATNGKTLGVMLKLLIPSRGLMRNHPGARGHSPRAVKGSLGTGVNA